MKYAGSDQTVDLVRDSNSFKVDGMTISVNGEFGYVKDEATGELKLDPSAEAVTFDAKVDEDKIVETVKKMVEDGRDCSEVLIQIAAVRSAINNIGKVILQDHIQHCIVDAVELGDQEAIANLCQAIDKFVK